MTKIKQLYISALTWELIAWNVPNSIIVAEDDILKCYDSSLECIGEFDTIKHTGWLWV